MHAIANNARWGILLAGGEGRRMRPLIRLWLGENRSKQYCMFVGSHAMFQHTTDRARWVASYECVMTVVTREHRTILNELANGNPPGLAFKQPSNLGGARVSRRCPMYWETTRRPPLSFFLPVTLCNGSLQERRKTTGMGACHIAK